MKLIGIVGRMYYNKDNQEIIQTHEPIRSVLMNYDDVVCFTILPTENIDYLNTKPGEDNVNSKIDYLLDKCDGFIIPGGTYYYSFDEYVINYAIKNDKPLLAICLGFQALCSIYAKEKISFCMEKAEDNPNHIGNANDYKHKILIANNTLLKRIIGKDETIVNSIHHDIVDFEMKELVVSAKAEDGIIEAVEFPDKKFILGVQWHPEKLLDDNSKKIFDTFIDSMN